MRSTNEISQQIDPLWECKNARNVWQFDLPLVALKFGKIQVFIIKEKKRKRTN